jgi:hypothetical protein
MPAISAAGIRIGLIGLVAIVPHASGWLSRLTAASDPTPFPEVHWPSTMSGNSSETAGFGQARSLNSESAPVLSPSFSMATPMRASIETYRLVMGVC